MHCVSFLTSQKYGKTFEECTPEERQSVGGTIGGRSKCCVVDTRIVQIFVFWYHQESPSFLLIHIKMLYIPGTDDTSERTIMKTY